MSARGLADPRRGTPNAPGPHVSNAELAWPPTQEDLDAVEVLAVGPDTRALVVPPVRRARHAPTVPPVQPVPAMRRAERPALAPVELPLNVPSQPRQHARVAATRPARLSSFERAPRAQSSLRPLLFAVFSCVILLAVGWPIWQLVMSPEVPTVSAPPAQGAQQAEAIEERGQPSATSPAREAEAQPVAARPSTPLNEPPVPTPSVARPAVVAPSLASPPPVSEPPATRRDDVPASQARRPSSPPLSQVIAARSEPAGSPAEATPASRAEEPLTTAPTAAAPAPSASTAPTEAAPSPLSGTLPSDTTEARPNRAEEAAPPRTTSVPTRSDEMRVQAILQRYGAAYGQLDARAAQAVWPSVDARALARAFDGLESQTLQFDRCDLDVQGLVASADCRGRTTYVRRVGSKAPRTEARAWTFRLRKVGDDWQILKAEAR